MIHLLALLTVVLSAADHWTTYLCLRRTLPGWEVSEANPIAEWLFGRLGLVEGLLVDSAVTLVAVAFLLGTRHLSPTAKQLLFGFIALWTGYAVINNIQAISAMGLSLLGAA